jgi:hypothetical protein
MAMGNINASTQMATKAQMVGFVPRDSIKEVKKEEEHTNTIRELDQQDTENQSSRTGQDARGPQGTPQQTPDQGQGRVRQRQISAPQQHRAQQTEQKSGETKSEKTPDQTPQQGPAAGPRGRVAFDTSAQIQWRFNQAQAQQANGTENPQTQPEVQKRQFLSRLRQMVSTEYQQYVKSDDSLYSRRNLREIMQALNQDDPNSRRLRNDQDTRRSDDAPPSELEGYNKFNHLRAARSLKVVQERQEEPQQDRLLLVA